MSDLNFSPQERQRLINMYVTQYNQTNINITRLLDTLDDIRNNINSLIGNNMHNMHNMQRINRSNRSNRQNRQNYFNAPRPVVGSRLQNSGIHYDYNNPIERSTYINEFMNDLVTNNTSNMHSHENNPDITEFLTTFLNSVPVRPTQEEIDNSSRLIGFDSIQAPNSTTCAISLEPFASGDTVRQLHHCGHIFFPDQFNQWFRNNVRCPVCRHDIRSFTPLATSATNASATNASATNHLTIDISNNELSDNILSTIASRFLTSLLNPTANVSTYSTFNNNNDHIMYDSETDETILRSNNNQG
jgi:hypothetical protein